MNSCGCQCHREVVGNNVMTLFHRQVPFDDPVEGLVACDLCRSLHEAHYVQEPKPWKPEQDWGNGAEGSE
jgi:hypothetical protein